MAKSKSKSKLSQNSKTAIALIAILVVGIVVGVLWHYAVELCWINHDYDESGICTRCGNEKPTKNEESNDELVVMPDSNSVMRLSVMPTAIESSEKEKVLTLILLKGTIDNPQCDWSVAWADSSSSSQGTVTEFVTATTAEDGAMSATITCLKPFVGEITVTAKLRGNISSATASVLFEGKPSSLNFGDTTLTLCDEYYNICDVDEFTVDLRLNNAWNNVNEKYGVYEIISVTKHGSLIVANYISTSDGTVSQTNEKTIDFADWSPKVGVADIVEFYITDNKLSVICHRSIADAYLSHTRKTLPSTRTVVDTYSEKFKGIVTNCYYEVVVRDTVSNMQSTIKIGWTPEMYTVASISDSVLTY